MYKPVRCMWMRGGTSKGAFFIADDLPTDIIERDKFLLKMMGSPDERQIDGIGGADPLTSKVAIIRKSTKKNVDVDYLFLQVFVDKAVVTDAQNCGNILAGVAPFAIERDLISANDGETQVTIFMENTQQLATVKVATPKGIVNYQGEASIDGVPGTASAIPITFKDTMGSSCGALLPTGNQKDMIDGVTVTCIDNGMPVVVINALDMGISGNESREALEQNERLKKRLESIRLQAGKMMNLGDVTHKSVPKMSMVSPAKHGGVIATRTFIPKRCHTSIGVLGAVSVATACILPQSTAFTIANLAEGQSKTMSIEHPTGEMTVILELNSQNEPINAAILRTARKLFDGYVFA
ncbi:4-oxalomesaconate tautomerase [Thalassotalea castellviae]|uniref:4-oxalomesaconate tautomerase n=1 Tax=Thalassotalea castellviae TaxID=3075612 RepID=A0ABU3A442_9GAMM|nr:4-oxalomesaconate tautomerase [Thalassotalea sp. W431]MDT0603883.1 4-oxalomesaconate tautomerase [Thalassotalea sp. W431]